MDTTPDHQPDRSKLQPLARAGFLAKGIVYIIIGWLAVQIVIGSGGQTTGPQGALQVIRQAPAGQFLLILTGIGLVAYALWRLAQAIFDPEGESAAEGAKGTAKRIGFAISGLVYGSLGVSVLTASFGGGGGSGGGSTSTQGMVATLLQSTAGRWLVGIIGVIIIGVGLYQFKKAAEAKFMRKLSTNANWIRRAGQIGFAARGVVYGVIGVLTIVAAVQLDPSQTGGINEALTTLANQPYGPWLLGGVAVGLILYGVYAATLVRYRVVRAR